MEYITKDKAKEVRRLADKIMMKLYQDDRSGKLLCLFITKLIAISKLRAYGIDEENKLYVVTKAEYKKLRDKNMEEKILTKEEYLERLNNLVKPMVEFATNTKQFNNSGYYAEEFIKNGDKECTLIVMDNNWIAVSRDVYYDSLSYKGKYLELERKYRELKKEYESKYRKKIFGIF